MSELFFRVAGFSPRNLSVVDRWGFRDHPIMSMLFACIFCTTALPSCILPPKPIESTRQRHVLILPGILGSPVGIDATQALRAQIEWEMPDVSAQVWDWTALESTIGIIKLDNLTDYARNRRRASLLARDIETWTRQHPSSPLYLLAQSGGAGIALFACEELPPDVTLEGIILVSGGVSITYNPTHALDHTRLGIFNYYSHKDVRILRDLTIRHGTMDRVKGPAIGYAGFTADHPKLYQLAWNPTMRRLGNWGGHATGLRRAFVRRYYLPLLKGDANAIPPEWRGNL